VAQCATLLCAALGFSLRLGAIPSLTTTQDTLFNSDRTRFNGIVTISWQSFEALDASDTAGSSIRLQIVNGLLVCAARSERDGDHARDLHRAI
jgi:hypothetical protein